METNKSSIFEWTDTRAVESEHVAQTRSNASNDAEYNIEAVSMPVNYKTSNQDKFNKTWSTSINEDESAASIETSYKKAYSTVSADDSKDSNILRSAISKQDSRVLSQSAITKNATALSKRQANIQKNTVYKEDILERAFMNSLIKHTGIALAIIIPLAAFSAYAAAPPLPASINVTDSKKTDNKKMTASMAVEPASIIYKSATMPTTVDNVDLQKYAGKWYEIGRLPMYFQRNCASNVTATYTQKTDGSGITVLNQCSESDGTPITAEGLAKPADNTGSKLKVTFMPSWIRWLPVGRADYWVLARDPNYQTALVGTPDQEYLWLLARTPNISQETYAKYRKIAQEQGYNLKEFKLTAQNNQTVNLVP